MNAADHGQSVQGKVDYASDIVNIDTWDESGNQNYSQSHVPTVVNCLDLGFI